MRLGVGEDELIEIELAEPADEVDPGIDGCPRRTCGRRKAGHEDPPNRCWVAAQLACFAVQQLNAFAREPHDFVPVARLPAVSRKYAHSVAHESAKRAASL